MQLQLETLLKTFFVSIPLFDPAIPIHPAHATDKLLDGSFLLIIADLPEWEEMVINAVVPVRLELATTVKDPDARSDANIAHSINIDKIIELFSDQKYLETKAALNAIDPAALQFTGWETRLPHDSDGTTDTQVVSRLNYVFEVFLPTAES